MRKIVFSPWVGELGWELFTHQAYIRKISRNYDYVVCSSLERNEILYEDFCDEFVPFKHDRRHSNMQLNTLHNSNNIINSKEYKEFLNKYKGNEIRPIGLHTQNIREQEFIEYGEYKKELVYDVVCHMRNRTTWAQDRNFGEEKWRLLIVEFLKQNKKVACIGGSDDFCFEGVDDFRLCGLKTESNLLKSSKKLIGTISGGIHFGFLCDIETIIWGKENYRNRIENDWNPFNLKTTFIGEVSPSVEKIISLL